MCMPDPNQMTTLGGEQVASGVNVALNALNASEGRARTWRGPARLALCWLSAQRGRRLAVALRMARSDQPGAGVSAQTNASMDASSHAAIFDALFRDLERSVYGYLWRMLGDQQAAADLKQETFLRAWRHIEKISAYERPETWVWRVATNLALNERRRVSTWGLQSLDMQAERLAASDPAMRVVGADQVHATLLALPARLRAALTLREVYGLTFEEIAQALDISPASARVTLSRARDQFRQRYQRTEGVQ